MKTLAHEFLDIEAEDFEVPQECYDTIDDLLEKAKERIDVEAEPEVVLESIGRVLEEYGFTFKKNKAMDSLRHVLQTKGMVCRHASVLYYSIGEALGLPIRTMNSPEHIFVKWYDGSFIPTKWETTKNAQMVEERYPHKDLTRDEMKSIALIDRGLEKEEKGNLEGAISDFDKAIVLDPNHIGAYANRGNMKVRRRDFKGAIPDYDKAIALSPSNYLACALFYIGRGGAKIMTLRLISGIKDIIVGEYKLWRGNET